MIRRRLPCDYGQIRVCDRLPACVVIPHVLGVLGLVAATRTKADGHGQVPTAKSNEKEGPESQKGKGDSSHAVRARPLHVVEQGSRRQNRPCHATMVPRRCPFRAGIMM